MLVKAGKLLVTLFVIYISWYYGAIGPNNYLLYGLAIGVLLFVVADMLINRKSVRQGWYSLLPMLVVFGGYALLSGLFVSINRSTMISSMVTYFAYVAMCYCACYLSRRGSSMEWITQAFLIAAIMCAVQTIFFGKPYSSSGVYVTTMGPHNNPNSLGLVMVFGIFAAVNNRNFLKHFFISLVCAVAFLYIVILTGSRKCLIAGVVLFGIWLVVYLWNEGKKGITVRFVSRLALVFLAVLAILIYYLVEYENTSIFVRMQGFFGGDLREDIRFDMYEAAFEIWREHPILGAGYDQYRYYYFKEVYSHSTYAELLACHGIFGVLIWLVPLAKKTFTECRYNRKLKGLMGYRNKMNLVMLFIELLMAAGQIWYYDFTHLLILIFIFGFSLVEGERIKADQTDGAQEVHAEYRGEEK